MWGFGVLGNDDEAKKINGEMTYVMTGDRSKMEERTRKIQCATMVKSNEKELRRLRKEAWATFLQKIELAI